MGAPTSRELWAVWDELVRGSRLALSYKNMPDMVRDLCQSIVAADESMPLQDRDQRPFPFYGDEQHGNCERCGGYSVLTHGICSPCTRMLAQDY